MEGEIFEEVQRTNLQVPELIASTGATYSRSIRETSAQDGTAPSEEKAAYGQDIHEANFFKSMQWSPDGTCLITNSADNTLRTFIAPADLLSASSSPRELQSYSFILSAEPIYSVAAYPFFALSDPSTTLVLSSVRDHPIRLSNVLASTTATSSTATYLLVSPTTEDYLTPSSMVWTPDGTHFLTGTESLIALFDVSRSGSGPATRMPTIPSKRHKMKGGGVGMRGIVSSLSLQPNPGTSATCMLAAGSWTRWVSLYDSEGSGGTVANWSIASAADAEAQIGGAGVAQTAWSPCGRYLFVAERRSRGVLMYDVRVTGKLVGWLEGRAAESNQRLGLDVFGDEIWAGGTDGSVRVWEHVTQSEGGRVADWSWKAHDSAVGGVGVHQSGYVVASASGQRRPLGSARRDSSQAASESSDSGSDSYVGSSRSDKDEDEDESDSDSDSDSDVSSVSSVSSSIAGTAVDSSIKIWSLA